MITWFKNNELKLIDAPAYSSEYNAIECVWSWLKNYVHSQQPKNKTEVGQAIDNGCDAIPQKVIQQYILYISTVMQEISKCLSDNIVFISFLCQAIYLS